MSEAIKAIAFENKENKGRYCANGHEAALLGDENGDVSELEYAMLVVRDDFEKPTEEDMDNFKKIIENYTFFDYNALMGYYNPVQIEITQEQFKKWKEDD